MDDATTEMTAELRDMLADAPRLKRIDPRSVPVRFSTAKAAGQSGAHYLHAVQDERDETLAMRLGSGAHGLLFDKPVALWDQPAKKGAGKAPRNGDAWELFRKRNEGATILNAKEMAKAKSIAGAIQSNEIASRLLFGPGTVREQRIDFEWMGRKCRATPDARGPLCLVDLKTTKCAEPARFARDAMWRGYHAQLAFYRLAMEAAGHGRARHVYIVAVESAAPHAVTVLQLTDRALEQGEKLCRLWMERLLGFEASNAYPGYLETVGDFDVPDDDGVELVFADDGAGDETDGDE